MEGVPPGKNETADLLHTFTDAADDAQYLWEAFPADGGSARTAYMFLYSDDKPERPNFTALLDTYLHLLPKYQVWRLPCFVPHPAIFIEWTCSNALKQYLLSGHIQILKPQNLVACTKPIPSPASSISVVIVLLQGVPLSQIKFKRILFGGFPCYVRGSPLPPAFDRVLQIGDAAAGQSPLSFGGFGSMARHLPRLTRGLDQSLREDRLRRQQLGWLQPYQPSLSLAWLFQRSMSIKVGQLRRDVPAASSASTSNGRGGGERGWLPVDHINRLMRCNFAVMKVLGDRVLRPFVQDAIQLGPLMLTMLGMSLRDPVAVTRVLFQVGPGMILGWFKHYVALAAYTVMFWALRPLRGVIKAYAFQRLVDALEYGSSSDYRYAPPAAGEAAAASGARVGDQRVPEGAWLANGGAPEGHRQPAGVLQM